MLTITEQGIQLESITNIPLHKGIESFPQPTKFTESESANQFLKPNRTEICLYNAR